MDDDRPGARLPAARGMGDRAREIAAGAAQPALPRDAATVILVRPAAEPDGVETFLLQRTRALDFAPGACVFPGGSATSTTSVPEPGTACLFFAAAIVANQFRRRSAPFRDSK